MLLTCSNCETIFRVDSQTIRAEGQTVRCSVCSHVWFAVPPKGNKTPPKPAANRKQGWKVLAIPFGFLVMLALAVGVAIHQRVTLTAYLPGLIPAFDVVGLTIRPQISILEVVDLQASHSGDNLRLSGNLRNKSGMRTHASDLLVTVRASDGSLMNEMVIKADDRFIEAGEVTAFFVQMTVEQSDEAAVTVVPIGSRIYE